VPKPQKPVLHVDVDENGEATLEDIAQGGVEDKPALFVPRMIHANKESADWMLTRDDFAMVKRLVQTWHAERELPMPPDFHTQWTDGCCDILGTNKHLPRYCSPQNSFFKQSWVGQNVYVHPPFDKQDTGLFLAKYLADARKAKSRGVATRGVFILPVWPHAPWWHMTHMFERLHTWRRGEDSIFMAAPTTLGGERRPFKPIPFDVVVLFDPGVTMSTREPTQTATQHAVSAIDATLSTREGTRGEAGGGVGVPYSMCTDFDMVVAWDNPPDGMSKDARRRRRRHLFKQWSTHGPLGWYVLQAREAYT
jgi:hypothetical protein